MMETDESFDDDPLGVQALHVESDEDDLDLNIPPTTGNEYLRRVRMEANECPKVVVANMDTKAFKQKQTVHVKQWTGNYHPAPSGFCPSLRWQNMQVANFAEQRQNLARYKAQRKRLKVAKLPTVPPANDVEAWCRLCFGRIKPPARSVPTITVSKVVPSVTKVVLEPQMNLDTDLRMNTDTKVNMDTKMNTDTKCGMNTESIADTQLIMDSSDVKMEAPSVRENVPPPANQRVPDTQQTEAKFPTHEGILPLVSLVVAMDQPTVIKVLEYHINWFEVTGFTEKQGYWFYALLVSLDKPLTPDACSLLRDLARACSRLRASLESCSDWRLVPLNLFICLIARYFDQSDLKDDVS